MFTLSRMTPPPRPCSSGLTYTVSRVSPPLRPSTWDRRLPVSRVTPSQTLHLGSHVQGFQGDRLLNLQLWSQVHSLQGDTPLQTMYLESHIHSLLGEPSPQTRHMGSHIQWGVFWECWLPAYNNQLAVVASSLTGWKMDRVMTSQ